MATEVKNAITMRDFATVLSLKRYFLDEKTMANPLFLGTVIGVTKNTKRKAGALPSGEVTESVVLEGRYEMTKANDGEIVEATAVFLPNAFAAMVEGALEQEGVDHMQFAIEVWAKARGTDGAFAYTVKSLIQREVDPFKEIRAKAVQAGAKIMALPAPAPHAEHVTGPELDAPRATLEATAEASELAEDEAQPGAPFTEAPAGETDAAEAPHKGRGKKAA